MNAKTHLLVVEDDSLVGDSLVKGLTEAGYEVDLSCTLQEARDMLGRFTPDLMVLDLNLPDGDGLSFLKFLRDEDLRMPVVILTARDTVDDRVEGLDGGGNDYMIKPFAFPELLARIRACLRNKPREETSRVAVADLKIDLLSRTAARGDRIIDLTTREFDLLYYLAARAGEVVSRDMLVREVWGVTSRATPMDNIIEVHMSRLREKLETEATQPLIHTIRGVGYRLGGPS